ncbi:MAG TPA: SDR family NAD(P)-dependent oxidoreductase [Acidimicrobiales bacterium]|jgi:NAD(P)-dependent dehydrogenase (short-subunit alcohol dehydrogenase family)|nr:SDR family NAD(P)-dependent oxidoreductase [Acidimicrobiales bacterium]
MKELSGKVAVVTGGASGIGLALCRAFLHEGMSVVIADIEQKAIDNAVSELGPSGPVIGVRTDVSSLDSVEALADRVFRTYGACHVLCNNAGVGAPSAKVWATTPNDWRWVFGVNVTGVVNGILTFVPRMLAAGEEGHIVNTSSPDGPISPLSSASVYAASKAAVSTITECLAAQLQADDTSLRASVFYPSGGLMRTGLWTAERTRPPELARERPRDTTPMTIEDLEAMAQKAGRELQFQSLDELADLVVAGIKEQRFIMMLGLDETAATLRSRADSIEKGELPLTKAHLG